MTNKKYSKSFFERFSATVSMATGSTTAFIIACSLIIIWAVTGPIFNFSETWQLMINTGTTIITFLMVFLIQKSQNKDSMAIQLKLDELVASNDLSNNRLIAAEDMSDAEMKIIRKYYERLRSITEKNNVKKTSVSIDAEEKNSEKNLSKQRR